MYISRVQHLLHRSSPFFPHHGRVSVTIAAAAAAAAAQIQLAGNRPVVVVEAACCVGARRMWRRHCKVDKCLCVCVYISI